MKQYFVDYRLDIDDKHLDTLVSKFPTDQDAILSGIGAIKLLSKSFPFNKLPKERRVYSKKHLHFVHKLKKTTYKIAVLHLRNLLSIILACLEDAFSIQEETIFFQDLPISLVFIFNEGAYTYIYCGLFIEPEIQKIPSVGLNAFRLKPNELALDVLNQYTKDQATTNRLVHRLK